MARATTGLSLREFAGRLGISHNAVAKYENNSMMPDSGILSKILEITGVKLDYLFRTSTVSMANINFRQIGKINKKSMAQIGSQIVDALERYSEVESIFNGDGETRSNKIPIVDIEENNLESVETAAQRIRESLGLGRDAIRCLIDSIEQCGIIVVQVNCDAKCKFDGLCCFIGENSEIPVIAIDSSWPTDRKRFTVAHELGHLATKSESEIVANRFAGAFLLPREAVINKFGSRRTRILKAELVEAKHEYGISMGAILHRLFDLDVIGRATFEWWNMFFRKNGLNKDERVPLDGWVEEPTRFKTIALRAHGENVISESRLAELLGIPMAKLKDVLMENI